MPFYDYYCKKNRKTVEVFHTSAIKLKTWGQVCKYAGIGLGKTPANAPVVRLLNDITPTVFKLKGIDKDEPSKRLIV